MRRLEYEEEEQSDSLGLVRTPSDIVSIPLESCENLRNGPMRTESLGPSLPPPARPECCDCTEARPGLKSEWRSRAWSSELAKATASRERRAWGVRRLGELFDDVLSEEAGRESSAWGGRVL